MKRRFRSESYFEALAKRPDLNAVVGGSDPAAVSRGHLHLLQSEGLPVGQATLCDLGCGVGRTIASVLEVVPRRSTVLGIDVLPQLLDFCDAEIGSRRSGLEFRWLKTSSDHYDKYLMSDVVRPEFDQDSVVEGYVGSVDFLWAISVITHLDGRATLSVLRLISKLLSPTGRAVVTCFVMDPDSDACCGRGVTQYDLSRGQWDQSVFQGVPEDQGAFVGHTYDGLQRLFVDAGLYLQRMIPGTWRDSTRQTHTFHDVVVLGSAPQT